MQYGLVPFPLILHIYISHKIIQSFSHINAMLYLLFIFLIQSPGSFIYTLSTCKELCIVCIGNDKTNFLVSIFLENINFLLFDNLVFLIFEY